MNQPSPQNSDHTETTASTEHAAPSGTSKLEQYGEAAKERLSAAAHSAAESAASTARECSTHYVSEPAQDLFSLMRDYARQKPDVAAVWCFGVGVLVGWKLRR